jgi:hypothetical protein
MESEFKRVHGEIRRLDGLLKFSRSRRAITAMVVLVFALLFGLFEVYQFADPPPGAPGPISTFPASWGAPCARSDYGGMTTHNDIQAGLPYAIGVANLTLSQAYSSIVNSSSFKTASSGQRWVTTGWSLVLDSDGGNSTVYVVGQFVTFTSGIFGDSPVQYITAYYNPGTGAVNVNTGLTCS